MIGVPQERARANKWNQREHDSLRQQQESFRKELDELNGQMHAEEKEVLAVCLRAARCVPACRPLCACAPAVARAVLTLPHTPPRALAPTRAVARAGSSRCGTRWR